MDEQELAGGQAGLVLLILELGQVLLPAHDDVAGLGQLLLAGRVQAVAKELEGPADRLAHVVEHDHAALEVGPVEHGPGRLEILDLALEVGDAGVGQHIGDGVVHGLVDGDLQVIGIDMGDVGKQRLIQGLDHALGLEQADHVAGRGDDVIPRGPGLDLGVHGLVGVECVDDDLAGVVGFETGHDVGLDVIGPGIDMQDGRLILAADRENRQAPQEKDRNRGRNAQDLAQFHQMPPSRMFDRLSLWLTMTIVKVRTRSIVDRALMSGVAPCLIML